MNLSNVPINVNECFRDAKLIAAKRYRETVDGKAVGDPIGTRYTVLLPHVDFERVAVSVLGPQEIQAPEAGNAVPVIFEALSAKLKWMPGNNYILVGEATAIQIVKSKS